LDARTGAVVEADDWCAGLQCEVHQFVDLFSEHFAERAAEHGEVLAEDKYLAAVDGTPAGDYAVGVRTLVEPRCLCAVSRQQVEFVETAGVEQRVDSFAREHLALFVLALHRARAARVARLVLAGLEIGDFFGDGVDGHETTLVVRSTP